MKMMRSLQLLSSHYVSVRAHDFGSDLEGKALEGTSDVVDSGEVSEVHLDVVNKELVVSHLSRLY